MSKGTPVVPVRIAPELIREIEDTIARRNFWSREIPWSVSDFIRIACKEKIRKMERCRKKK